MVLVTMTDFPSVAFQSSLSLAGILFGVFGFLYTLYGLFTSQLGPQHLTLPPITKSLKRICRFLVFLLFLTAFLNATSIGFMYYYSNDISGTGNMILAGTFIAIIFALAIVSLIAVSRMKP